MRPDASVDYFVDYFVLLDIDGVLLPIRQSTGNESWDSFPETCLRSLSRILVATEATLVLSSTWRATADAQQHIINES